MHPNVVDGPYDLTLNGRFLTQPITGVQRVAREFLSELDRMIHAGEADLRVRVMAPAAGDLIEAPVLKVVRVERAGRLSGHAWEQAELPWLAGSEPLLCLGNTAPIARLLTRRGRTVTMVHDLSYAYFPAAYDWKFRALYQIIMPRVLRWSDAVVTVSASERAAISRHYPFMADDPRFSFTQNGGLEDRTMADAPPFEGRPNDYLYVGSLTKRKNAQGLLEASLILAREDGASITFVGANGPSFEGTTLDVPSDLEGKLRFLGQINDAGKIFEEYRKAKALLFPSFYEASPLPPIEAMSFGCPVVASRIPSLEERCGDAAVYCDAHDTGSIVEAARSLTSSQARWADYAQRGRLQAAKYSWGRQARDVLALLKLEGV